MEEAVSKSSSFYLRRDYRKAIAKKKRELKEYCKYKGILLEEGEN